MFSSVSVILIAACWRIVVLTMYTYMLLVIGHRAQAAVGSLVPESVWLEQPRLQLRLGLRLRGSSPSTAVLR